MSDHGESSVSERIRSRAFRAASLPTDLAVGRDRDVALLVGPEDEVSLRRSRDFVRRVTVWILAPTEMTSTNGVVRPTKAGEVEVWDPWWAILSTLESRSTPVRIRAASPASVMSPVRRNDEVAHGQPKRRLRRR